MQRLSSTFELVITYLFAFALTVLAAAMVVAASWSGSAADGVATAAVAAAVIGLVVRYVAHFRRVVRVRDGLLVDNFVTTVHVPFTQIARVREVLRNREHYVEVELVEPCRFGRAFRFFPVHHEAARSLREAVRAPLPAARAITT